MCRTREENAADMAYEENERQRHGMIESEILQCIVELLDGVEWTSDTLDNIAEVLTENGYRIRDLDDRD